MASNDNVEEKEYQGIEVIATMNDTDSDDDEDNGAWSFESDHAALKNNSDYMNLLRTLTILQAQRTQTAQDLEKIRAVKRKAVDDPVLFVKRIQKGEDIGLPPPIKIAEVPRIDWANYKAGPRRLTRLDSRGSSSTNRRATTPDSKATATDDPGGGTNDGSKSATYNQPWSAEEQGRLEELLAEFPPEQVEQNRFRKIAAALGNRTAKQVCSRMQKYFVKLHEAGLPIPGRSQRRQGPHPPRAPSPAGVTLASSHSLDTVWEMEAAAGEEEDMDSDESDDPTMNIAGKVESARWTHLVTLLQRVLESRKGERPPVPPEHHGFKCDLCQEEPIVGTRWHCATCADTSYDFCEECVITQAESSTPHPLSHRLMPISSVDPLYDEDYGPKAFARMSGD